MRNDRYKHLVRRLDQDINIDLSDPCDRAILTECGLDEYEANELCQLHDALFTSYGDQVYA